MSYDAPYDPMAMLKQFHDRYHPDKRNRKIGELNHDLLRKRKGLIREEAKEVSDAIEYLQHVVVYPESYNSKEQAIQDLAKELADLLYVVYGTAEELGIPLDAVFETVHWSNMDKLWPDGEIHYNSEGKVLKPPTYSPPDLSYIHDDRV